MCSNLSESASSCSRSSFRLSRRSNQDVRNLVLHITADAPPPSWIRVRVTCLTLIFSEPALHPKTSPPPSSRAITTVLSYLRYRDPNLPIAIPLPPSPPPTAGIPFITHFSHAYPTCAPGDTNGIHSVLNTFFQAPVSGEEKKRRLRERIADLYPTSLTLLLLLTLPQVSTVERSAK